MDPKQESYRLRVTNSGSLPVVRGGVAFSAKATKDVTVPHAKMREIKACVHLKVEYLDGKELPEAVAKQPENPDAEKKSSRQKSAPAPAPAPAVVPEPDAKVEDDEEEFEEDDLLEDEEIDKLTGAELKEVAKEWSIEIPSGTKVPDAKEIVKAWFAAKRDESEE